MKEIFGKVVEWGDERFISAQAYDKNGYVANIVSELREYIDAVDDDERVDALCDIVVFTLTEMPKLGYTKEEISNLELICSFNDISIVEYNIIRILGKLVDEEFKLEYFQNLIELCLTSVELLGYNSTISMEETHREIDSRKGDWNDEVKKWKKFTDEYHKSLWVKADYSRALKCK